MYTDDSNSVAVQALDDGSLRLQSISHNDEAPDSYSYDFGSDVTLLALADGSVLLTNGNTEGSVVTYGSVDAPWAYDADGESVETWYEIDGSTLSQVVLTNASTSFPVVADPRLTFGTRIYWSLSRTEQKYFGSMGAAGAAAYLCGQTAGLGCAAAVAAATGIGMYLADRGGACPASKPWLQVGMPYGYPANPVPGVSIACRATI